jgi:hypothetical protein
MKQPSRRRSVGIVAVVVDTDDDVESALVLDRGRDYDLAYAALEVWSE